MPINELKDQLKCFFEPESVAIVGASRNPAKFGHFLLKNLIDFEFKGKIYPVNPHANEILGLRAYPSVDQIDDEVDLAVIIVPAPIVPKVMEDCSKKRVKGVVICSSGFSEMGKKGLELERKVLEIAKNSGIRVIGPNTTGILNTSNNFTTSFAPLPKFKRGNVAFIAQTGLFAAAAFWWIISTQPFGISKVVGLGNKCDVDDSEVIDYLAEDKDTEIIAIYMEGVKNGRRLFEVLKRVAPEKPIIILKSGRTATGAKASMSHTGSIAVDDRIFDAVCKQTGVIRVEGDFEELLDVTKAFALQPLPAGNRVAVVTLTGAGGVMAADECERHGLKLATLCEKTLRKIRDRMPSWASISNPADIEPLFEAVGPEESLRISLEAVLEDENVDCVVAIFVSVPRFVPIIDMKRVVDVIERRRDKPVFVHLLGYKENVDKWTKELEKRKIPVYPSIKRCINALGALWKYKLRREKLKKANLITT